MDEYTKWVLISGFYWLVSSITAAAIAEWKHRSGGGFFLASFFFLGPLGVAVALLATPGEVRQFGPTGTSGQTATAPTGKPSRAASTVPAVNPYKVGQRVVVVDTEHKRYGREGEVTEIVNTYYVQVKFNAFTEDVFDPSALKPA